MKNEGVLRPADLLTERRLEPIFAFQSLFIFALVISIALWSNSMVFEGSSRNFHDVLFIVSVLALGQSLLAIFATLIPTIMMTLFVADCAVIMVLVKASGSSVSPFLVLFPLLSLAASIVFKPKWATLLLGINVFFIGMAVGFGPAIAGNVLASSATSILGMYLVKALDRSGEALQVSEHQRRRLENLQKAIVTNIPSGLMSIDSQGRVIQVNSVGLKILGVEESKLIGNSLVSVLPALSTEVHRLSTLIPNVQALDPHSDRPKVEYKNPKTQAKLQLGYSIARLWDPEDGSILGSLVVFQDLTEIIEMEERLRTSEKLGAVGKLAAGIAHEIRNPLAGISGSAQLLLGNDSLHDEDRSLLKIIQRESTRLDLLITEFLEYVKPAQPKLENVNLKELVAEVVAGMQVSSKWRDLKCEILIRYVADSESSPTKVQGDRNKITQVLMNFLYNAGQAGATQVELLIDSRRGRLAVRDNGAGIKPEHQRRLFEPFFTTKEKGTGLGLATSYKILEVMGARVEVQSPCYSFSPKGGGTEFAIWFKEAA